MTERDAGKSEEEGSLQAVGKEEPTEAESQDSEETDAQAAPLPKSIRQFIQSYSMTLGTGFPAFGMFEKLKDKHITQFIEHIEEESKRVAADRNSQRRYAFATFVFSILAVFAFIALLVFTDESDLLVPVLTYIATLIGGFGAGWGLGRRGKP